MVHVFKLDEPNVEKREAMITNLEFLAREELLQAVATTLETWSQLCVDQLDRVADAPTVATLDCARLCRASLIAAAVRR